MSRRLVLSLALLHASIGCGDGREAARATREQERVSPDTTERATEAAPSPAAGDAPERLAPPPATKLEDPDDAQDENNLTRVLGAAAAAADRAPRGSDLCETALNGLRAMIATVRRDPGGGALAEPDGPAFLDACRAMPRPVQQCLVPSYAFERTDECARIVDGAPSDVRERLEAAVQGQGTD